MHVPKTHSIATASPNEWSNLDPTDWIMALNASTHCGTDELVLVCFSYSFPHIHRLPTLPHSSRWIQLHFYEETRHLRTTSHVSDYPWRARIPTEDVTKAYEQVMRWQSLTLRSCAQNARPGYWSYLFHMRRVSSIPDASVIVVIAISPGTDPAVVAMGLGTNYRYDNKTRFHRPISNKVEATCSYL